MKTIEQLQSELDFITEVINILPTPYVFKDADDDFRFVRCNEAYSKMFCSPKSEIIGKRDQDFFPPELVQHIRKFDMLALDSTGPVISDDSGVFRSNSEVRLVRCRKQKVVDKRGHRLILCILKDMTDIRRKMAEEAFRADVATFLAANLNHAEFRSFVAKQLLNYFDCQHVMIVDNRGTRYDWCSDDADGHECCNQCTTCPMRTQYHKFFGARTIVKIDDVSQCDWVKLPPECPNKSILGHIVSFAGNVLGSIVVFYTKNPKRFTLDGEKVVQYAAEVIALSYQRSRAFEELANKNRELVEERDRAVAAERAKSFFFSTVSHDIRTPLNAIIGFSQLLKLGIDDAAERMRVIDSIVVSGKTLLQLINDVLDLSKLEAGRMEILPDPTDCRRLVQEIVESFRVANTNKNVEVIGNCSQMPILLIDAQRVRQVLFNLVGNAVKFTKEGSVTVDANYDVNTLKLEFSVRDTGCGISDEDQAKIANPYVQVGEKSARNGGTGLGLAICRQLVSAMNGEIELESQLGVGTTFYVTLNDVKNGEKVRRERLSATQQMKVNIPAKLSKHINRVLLVDDSAMNLTVLKAMLSRLGLKAIDTAVNGIDALEKMNAAAYDLVLTDLWMPEMDGEKLVKEIRKNEAWAKLPVYAVTADVEAQKNLDGIGFTDILLKPITFDKLKQIFSD